MATSIIVPPALQVELPQNNGNQQPQVGQRAQIAKSHLVHTFLRLILAFTGLPGYFGVDEEESEMTLGFWYLFQEALWGTEYQDAKDLVGDNINEIGDNDRSVGGNNDAAMDTREKEQVRVAKEVYIELVQVLRRKVTFPPPSAGWNKGKF